MKRIILMLFVGLLVCTPLFAADERDLVVAWEYNGSNYPDLAGFKIYKLDADVIGGQVLLADVADQNARTYTISGILPSGSGDIYIVMTAYDSAGNESVNSQEVRTHCNRAPSPPMVITVTCGDQSQILTSP